MKKYKQFMFGLIAGAVLFGGIPAIAQQIYNIIENPYKVMVNNQEQIIQGYNIDGYSYFKLRDVGAYVGFETDFKEDTILINTKQSTPTPTDTSNQDGYFESDIHGTPTIYHDKNGGIWYSRDYISDYLCKNIVVAVPNANVGDITYNVGIFDKTADPLLKKPLLEHIPYEIFEERICISKEVFETQILPLDESLTSK